MIPLVSADVMRECDADAVARWGVDALVSAAGHAVAHEVHRMLGSLYGRRVAVVVGPGLNGADGVVCARVLRSRGSRVDVIRVDQQPSQLEGYALVVDAAFGLGCSRPYEFPRLAPGTRVLAVDLPSGVDADSGAVLGAPARADVTLAIGALKYAHLDGAAADLCGELRVANLGIAVPLTHALVTDEDLAGYVASHLDDHKWSHAVSVFAGSTLMPGAAALLCAGALAGGASMVRLESRGDVARRTALPPEVVRVKGSVPDPRSRCVVAGPGLGPDARDWLIKRVTGVDTAMVLDADALTGEILDATAQAPRVITPHLGEFLRLGGQVHDQRRIDAVRHLAARSQCVVLLKGRRTIIAAPSGQTRVVNSGTANLATAGSGDVLTGMIAGAVARGHGLVDAAALSAHLHGRAGRELGPYEGASELSGAVRRILDAGSAVVTPRQK